MPFIVKNAAAIQQALVDHKVTSSKLHAFERTFEESVPCQRTGRAQVKIKTPESWLELFERVVKHRSSFELKHELPECLANRITPAIFGTPANVPSAGHDYGAFCNLRYQNTGKRQLFLMDFCDFRSFMKEEFHESDVDTMEKLKQAALTRINDTQLQRLKDGGKFFGASLHPGSLMYVPPTFFVWELCETAVSGVRYSCLLKEACEHKSLQAWCDAYDSSSKDDNYEQLVAAVSLDWK